MTQAIAPPPTPTVPVYPALGSPSFNQDAYDYASAMPGVSNAIGALAQNVADNAGISHDNAQNAMTHMGHAQDAMQAAQTAQAAAQAAANFAGMWSALSGPLNRPATVKHNDLFWLLLADLPNVATSEPGVSADWESVLQADTRLPLALSVTYTAGLVTKITEDGVETNITYNSDGTVHTISFPHGSLTRTETYSYSSGVLTGMSASEA